MCLHENFFEVLALRGECVKSDQRGFVPGRLGVVYVQFDHYELRLQDLLLASAIFDQSAQQLKSPINYFFLFFLLWCNRQCLKDCFYDCVEGLGRQ